MASQRLTFLYPHLFKPARFGDAALRLKSPHPRPQKLSHAAGFSSTAKRSQETVAQRYGTAQEPQLPPPPNPGMSSEDKTLAEAIETEVKGPIQPPEKKAELPPIGKDSPMSSKSESKEEEKALPFTSRDLSTEQPDIDKSAVTTEHQDQSLLVKQASTQNRNTSPPRAIEKMFHLPPPTVEQKPEEHKAPHMQAPPYVHHFDTYTLVKDLGKGGFTEDQSVTIMKAVRVLLAENLDMAKEGLVGKSDVENVGLLSIDATPLFHFVSFLQTPLYLLRTAPRMSQTDQPLPLTTGNLPLPRRLLRAAQRNPQRAPHLERKPANTTTPPATQRRHPLPTRLTGHLILEG